MRASIRSDGEMDGENTTDTSASNATLVVAENFLSFELAIKRQWQRR
jgi:hypothetical protein